MSETNEMVRTDEPKPEKESTEIVLIKDDSAFQHISEVVSKFNLSSSNISNSFLIAGQKAGAIQLIKKALTDEIVKKVKGTLENTRLGFRTDKDSGYPLTTIRTALIEAALMGVEWHGNQFNIIADNAYITREGFKGLMDRDEKLTDYKATYGVPDYQIDNERALINVKAAWKYNGKEDSYEDNIPVKITVKKFENGKFKNYTSDDAVIGKADRKLRKRVWEIVTGQSLPDTDEEELDGGNIYTDKKHQKATTEEFSVVDDDKVKNPQELAKWFKRIADPFKHDEALSEHQLGTLYTVLQQAAGDEKKIPHIAMIIAGRKFEKLVLAHYIAFQKWLGFDDDDIEIINSGEWSPAPQALEEIKLMFSAKNGG